MLCPAELEILSLCFFPLIVSHFSFLSFSPKCMHHSIGPSLAHGFDTESIFNDDSRNPGALSIDCLLPSPCAKKSGMEAQSFLKRRTASTVTLFTGGGERERLRKHLHREWEGEKVSKEKVTKSGWQDYNSERLKVTMRGGRQGQTRAKEKKWRNL